MGIYSQTLDGSYTEKIKAVYEHLGEIKKVADRLSPVEDLQDFKGQIEQLHSRLDLIVEASNIIVGTTEVGESVITAPSWTALRNLLGLEEFPTDVVYVHMLNQALDTLWQQVQDLVAGITFDVPSGILDRLADLERISDVLVLDITNIQTSNSAFSSLIFGLQQTYSNLSGTVGFVQSAISGLEMSYEAHGETLTAFARNFDEITQEYENLETGISVLNHAYDGIETRMDIHDGKIQASSTAITSLTTSVTDLITNTTANANAISQLQTSVSSVNDQIEIMAQHITQLDVDLSTAFATAISEAEGRLTVRIEENDGLIRAIGEDVTTLESTVSKKNRTFVQSTQPNPVAPEPPLVKGDLWINTSKNNEIKTYQGGSNPWVLRELAGGAKTHVGPPYPSGTHKVGDLWFNTSDDNKMYRWDGYSWVLIEDLRITATAQAVEVLRTDVFDGPNGLSAVADKVTNLRADVDDQSAQISEAMSVAVRAVVGNYVENPGFEEEEGWGSAIDGTEAYPIGMYRHSAGANTGSWGLAVSVSSPQSMTRKLYNEARIRVIRGDQIQIGCRYRKSSSAPFSGNVRFALRVYTASGAFLREDLLPVFEDWETTHKLHLSYYTVPANVSEVQLLLITTNSSQTYYIDDVFVKNLSIQEAEVIASHTLDLDVNGYVSGTRHVNNGTTASFKVNADVFEVGSPSGYGARLQWQNNALSIFDSSNKLRIKLGIS